ncbi:unnamed protein product [Amoebophrya sp. A25]|nr:unnamed protein product [Amoebophrya sp. A25]|eukprot:GSA25T00022897001.1
MQMTGCRTRLAGDKKSLRDSLRRSLVNVERIRDRVQTLGRIEAKTIEAVQTLEHETRMYLDGRGMPRRLELEGGYDSSFKRAPSGSEELTYEEDRSSGQEDQPQPGMLYRRNSTLGDTERSQLDQLAANDSLDEDVEDGDLLLVTKRTRVVTVVTVVVTKLVARRE